MKHSRTWTRLYRSGALALVCAALIGLGACSGSDGLSKAEVDDLKKKHAEELDKAKKDAEAEADRKRREAAEAERKRQEAERKRQEAEEERKKAEEERDEAQQTLSRFVALEIVNAIPTAIPTSDNKPSVPATLSYNKPVLATADTGATFTSTSTGSSGGWFKTTRSGSSEQRRDFVEIFSNVEAPLREDIRDYSARTAVPSGVTTELPWGLTFDAQGKPTNHLNITTGNAGSIAASSSFPRPSTQRQGEKKTFTVTDRGPNQTEKTAAIAEKKRIDDLNKDGDPSNDEVWDKTNTHYVNYQLAVRKTDRYPERYSIDISGTLQGASGTFRCAGTSETTGSGDSCTVDLSGSNNYVFASDDNVEWQFIPTSATSKVSVPDGEYMWFGWWKREPIETTPNAQDAVYDYEANYGGTNQVTSFAGATGPATYEGTAIGFYGVYDIEAAENDRSRAGRFQAKATLTADFGDATNVGTISGSITDFDTEPTWSVTLKSKAITSGGLVEAAADTVSWTIRGLPRDGGQWEAKFYSNFETPAETAQPTGVAGAFTAQYGDHRRMVGAFGAERD